MNDLDKVLKRYYPNSEIFDHIPLRLWFEPVSRCCFGQPQQMVMLRDEIDRFQVFRRLFCGEIVDPAILEGRQSRGMGCLHDKLKGEVFYEKIRSRINGFLFCIVCGWLLVSEEASQRGTCSRAGSRSCEDA
jgi:hypothetical protein